jgi:hypothetical protein
MMKYRIFVNKWNAMLWQRVYSMGNFFLVQKLRYGTPFVYLFASLVLCVSLYISPAIQKTVEPYFHSTEQFSGLQTFFGTLGGALIGAAAIAFTLVMFAMQVNVERMPHGLFRKFSSDWRLIGAFTGSILLAIAITALSLIPNVSWAALALLSAILGTAIILDLFLVAYRRALRLISPLEQLKIILRDVENNYKSWDRHAKRSAPLFLAMKNERDDSLRRNTHDLSRVAYFMRFQNWAYAGTRGIKHSASFVRRYVEQGDYEVSTAALNTIVAINAVYIRTKGKTFFDNNALIENPLSHDGFFNDTLEHIRQIVQFAISRRDEELLGQTFRTLSQLCSLYLTIDYSTDVSRSMFHANLASSYLSNAVEAVMPHNMPDVLMEGVRLMGEVAHEKLNKSGSTHATSLVDKIAQISCSGVIKENHRPVTMIGIQQLAKLSFALIRSKERDIHFASENIRENVKQVVLLFLTIPDTPFSSSHSTYLGPYFSSTSNDCLLEWLTHLGNAISDSDADDENAKRVISLLSQWSDQLYDPIKELLLKAIDKKSHFTFDVIHWISQVTQTLLAVSNAGACDDHHKDELRKNARWLICVLSWIPEGQESTAFIENFQIKELLFEAALDAFRRECNEVADSVEKLLLVWAFKAGKFQNGWGTFEHTLYALAALALERGQIDQSLVRLTEKMATPDIPSEEIRARAARNIREQAATFYRLRHSLRSVEISMERSDHEQLRPLLESIADIVSPETVGEEVVIRHGF